MQLSRRRILAVLAVVLVAGFLAAWWWFRPIRWSDAVTPPPPLAAALDAFRRGDVDGGLAGARRALREYDAPAWELRARVACAIRAEEARRPEVVLSILGDPVAPEEPLAAHADLLRARAALATGRAADAAAWAARAAAAPGFPHRDEALRTRSEAILSTNGPAAAAAVLDGSEHTDLAIEAARLAELAGDLEGARRRLADAVLLSPPGDAAERALEALQGLVANPAARFVAAERAKLATTARAWIDAKRPASALSLLRSIHPSGAPAAGRDPAAALLEAEALARLGRIAETRELLLRARSGDPATKDGALYWRARAEHRRGRRGAYLAALNETARRPGRSIWKLAALADLAEIADGIPTPAALAAYTRYRQAAGEAADPVALFREGFIAHELARGGEADAAFARVLSRADAPLGVRVAALYWSGRRAVQSGRRGEAEQLWRRVLEEAPAHYYAGVAERALRLSPPAPASPVIPRSEAAGIDLDGRRWIEAARALRGVGLAAWAWPYYRAAIDAASPEVALSIGVEAAQAALESASPAEALELVLRSAGDREALAPSSLPAVLWRLLLPAPSGPEIARAARTEGLEPALVAAIVLEESAFNPLAVSSAGARGLLQLMPPTAAELARKVGVREFDADRLFEPSINLRLGTAYLRTLRERLGSLPTVLAAYNAGPARAERWRRSNDDLLGEAYVERIPIPATRLYVKRILANFRLYRMVWSEGLEEESR